MQLTYRKLKPNETVLYRQLRLESLKKYPDNFGSNYEAQKSKLKLGFENYIEQESIDEFIMGAFDNGQLISICGFYRQQDRRSNHRGEIIQIYVQPAYQGKNIGRTILQKTIETIFEIKEIEQIELGVFSNSKAALKIYNKVGFKEYGLQKNYLKSEDNYIDLSLMVLHRGS